MPASVTLEEAQARLGELIATLAKGEELLIVDKERTVAKVVGEGQPSLQPRQPGSAKGILVIHAEDEEHLRDFEEYMK